ncbi:MAG: AAA family ATPase [Nanoarchaeota archaeon]
MIEKVKLHNWKSHAESEYGFTKGTNIIVGPMGAGKSSILQAVSFALFGTFSELKRKEVKISDIIRRGSDSANAQVAMNMRIGKDIFEITRTIEDGNTKEAVVRTKEGKLMAGPNAVQATTFLKGALKIDEDVFLRTVYAKQNELDLFLQLNPGERKTRLDELMGIDKFETARRNCVALLNSIEKKKSALEEFIKDFKIEDVEKEISESRQAIESLQHEKAELKIKISESEKEKSEADAKIFKIRKILEERSRFEEKKIMFERQLAELNRKLSRDVSESMDFIESRTREIKTKISELQRTKSVVREDLEETQRKALESEKKLGGLEQKSEEFKSLMAEIEKLKAGLREAEQEGRAEEIEHSLKASEEAHASLIDERGRLLGELAVLRKHLEELEGAKSTCPMCSSELSKAKRAGLISQRRTKAADMDRRAGEMAVDAENLRKKTELLKETLILQKELRTKIYDNSQRLSEEREITIQLSEIRAKKETFASIVEQMQQRFNSLDREIQGLDLKLSEFAEKKQLRELKDKEFEIKKEFDAVVRELESKKVDDSELKNIEKAYSDAIQKSQEFKSKIESNDSMISEKQKRLGDFEEKKNKFAELQGRIKTLADKIEFLSQFKNALLGAQDSLRKELIMAVNEVMAGLWPQLYPYSKWNSIRLDASESDYVLQIRDSGSSWISVAGFASGGERMIACLALRLAFAKVLTQNLSLLILDEPTHNLDEKAIRTFIDVIQTKLSNFLDQLFIITHDEKLAEAGDNIVRLD